MKYFLDARQCGAGKTTALITQINTIIAKDERVIVTVPSINLQNNYLHSQFNSNKLQTNKVKCINSDNTSICSDAYRAAITSNDYNVILITHETFKNTELKPLIAYLNNFHLIFDEAIDPYKCIDLGEVDIGNANGANLLKSFTQLNLTPEEEVQSVDGTHIDNIKWVNVDFKNPFSSIKNSQLSNQQAIKDASNSNYKKYVNGKTYQSNIVDLNPTDNLKMFMHFDFELLTNFKSVYVAAAAFKLTFMGGMFAKAKYIPKYIKINGKPAWFELHTNAAVHLTTPKVIDKLTKEYIPLVWSKKKADDLPQIAELFREEQNKLEDYILLSNISGYESMIEKDSCSPINHNPHGLNEFNDKTSIVIESALNPSPEFARFINFTTGFGQVEQKIAFSAYRYYQAILRLSVRNKEDTRDINVLMLDAEAGLLTLDTFFNNPNSTKNFLEFPIEVNAIGRPKVLTDEEKKKKRNERLRAKREAEPKKIGRPKKVEVKITIKKTRKITKDD